MRRIVRLTERDLTRLVKMVINESVDSYTTYLYNYNRSKKIFDEEIVIKYLETIDYKEENTRIIRFDASDIGKDRVLNFDCKTGIVYIKNKSGTEHTCMSGFGCSQARLDQKVEVTIMSKYCPLA